MLVIVLFVASCAQNKSPASHFDGQSQAWSGRISLRTIDTLSPTTPSFSATFTLLGSARQGELSLDTPLGTTLAHVSWTQNGARLTQGSQSNVYSSLDELTSALMGTLIPMEALFDWLGGRPTSAPGWTPDLSARDRGRITARHSGSAGTIELRVILDLSEQ